MRLYAALLSLISFLAGAEEPSRPPDVDPAVAPTEEWEGIPLPPGTKLYRKAGPSMIASVVMPFSDVERWYQSRMKDDGWEWNVVNRSETSLFGGAFVALEFKRKRDKVSVMLTDSPKEGYVMIQLTNVSGAT